MYRLSLGLICKNEKHNLPTLFESVKGCFDAIFVTDTGSTDGTRELLEEWSRGENPAKTPLFVSDFPWIQDFAAARNFNYDQLRDKSEYYMWLDADDSLVGADAFREWRDKLMPLGEQWLATYNYGDAGDGRNRCVFARERVFRVSAGFEWRYPIHEGVVPKDPAKVVFTLYASSWNVFHRRAAIDADADKSRNLAIFERLKAEGKPFDARMKFYYGKELFENRKSIDAFPVLVDAAAQPDAQLHDRILALQYACLAAADCNQPERAVHLAYQGLQLAPMRAEFHVIIADSLLRQNRIEECLPHYAAAKSCQPPPAHEGRVQSAIFQHRDAYTFYPRIQLAKCLAQLGRLEEARLEVEAARTFGEHPEIMPLLAEVVRLKQTVELAGRVKVEGHTPVDEIVITCPQGGFYEWDDSSLDTRGIGGSESAVVYLSREFAKLGKRVRIFGNVPNAREYAGGLIRYEPAGGSADYLAKHLPTAHIAWRHATRLSPAPSYVWCHDLGVPGLDCYQNYDAVLALSAFHADWLKIMCGIPDEKIRIVSNGIDKLLWADGREWAELGHERKPVVVWSSSPDRGLLTALAVMDEVVKEKDDAELHVFYGFDNMHKIGAGKQAEKIITECQKRPYVKIRGNLTKKDLTTAFLGSKAWLYPTDFLETFCITALEAQAAGLNVVVREFGALKERMAGMPGVMISGDPKQPEVFTRYVAETLKALTQDSPMVPLDKLPTWGKVAAEWLTWLGKRQ